MMDHSSSIITQVSRDEEENATCGKEGEFGRRFYTTFLLRMTPPARRETAADSRYRSVTKMSIVRSVDRRPLPAHFVCPLLHFCKHSKHSAAGQFGGAGRGLVSYCTPCSHGKPSGKV